MPHMKWCHLDRICGHIMLMSSLRCIGRGMGHGGRSLYISHWLLGSSHGGWWGRSGVRGSLLCLCQLVGEHHVAGL